MNCQNCHELIEEGAAFCGNCGYPVQGATPVPDPSTASPIAQVMENQQLTGIAEPPASQPVPALAGASVPTYARATPHQHAGETPAVLAVIFGVIGIAGAGFLVPIIGLAFGVAGLCVGTVSRRMAKRRLALIGLVLAALAIAAGLAALVYNQSHDKNPSQNAQTGQSDASSQVLSRLATPCYSFNLIDQYNVSNSSGSCDATAFNGQSFTSSTNIYKIVATKAGTNDPGTFTQIAKQAIDTDVKDNLPGFTVTSEAPASFAGSLAYTLYAVDKAQDTAVVETGVLHQTKEGDNAFDILHAINGSSTNLQALEAKWQWK